MAANRAQAVDRSSPVLAQSSKAAVVQRSRAVQASGPRTIYLASRGQSEGGGAVTDTSELVHRIEQYARTDGEHATAIPRLFLHRTSSVSEPMHMVYRPAVCLVAQGRKQGISGDRVYLYDALKYLVVSVDVPITSQVLEASPSKPYLCLRLDLDPAAIAALMLDADLARAQRDPPGPALTVRRTR